jgi:hypothetical protein
MFNKYEPINYLLTEEIGVNREITIIARAIEHQIKNEIERQVINNKNNLNYNLSNGKYKYREFIIKSLVNIPTLLNNNTLFPFDNIQTVLLLHVYQNNDKIKNNLLGYYIPTTNIYLSTKKINQGDIKLFYNANIETLERDIEELYPTIDHELLHALQVTLINHHKQKTNKTNSNTSYEYNKNKQINNILGSDETVNLGMNFPTIEYYLINHEMEARVQQLSRELQNIHPYSTYDKNKEIYNNAPAIHEYNNIKKYNYVKEYNTLFDDEKEMFIKILNQYNDTNKTSYGLKPQKKLTKETIINFLEKLDKIKDIKLSNLKRNFDKVFSRLLITKTGRNYLREWIDKEKKKPKISKQELNELREYYKSLKIQYKPDRITINNQTNLIAEVIYEEFNESIGYFGNYITENIYNENVKNKIIKLEHITEDSFFKITLIKRLIKELKNKGYEQILIPDNIHLPKDESIKSKTIKLTNKDRLINL